MVAPDVRGTSHRARWAYHELFHGQAGGVVNRYGERPYRPLPLVRNVNLVPPVFMPGAALVVDAAIGQLMAAFENVDVAPCVWESVYDDAVDAAATEDILGRFSWLTEDYGDCVRSRLRSPRTGERLPERFQIIAPFLDAVRAPFACDASLDIPSEFEDLPPTVTAAALHARYPVVRVETHFVFRADAFRVIEAHVGDRAVFTVLSFDLPE
jgi:hypothetical protein